MITVKPRKNICGEKIKELRKKLHGNISQRKFADMLCLAGFNCDKNVIQRIESGTRSVSDIELFFLTKVLDIAYIDLFDELCIEEFAKFRNENRYLEEISKK